MGYPSSRQITVVLKAMTTLDQRMFHFPASLRVAQALVMVHSPPTFTA